MSYLPDDEAEILAQALLEENPEIFFRVGKFSTYWPLRRKTDQWVRTEFERKGGMPVEPYPQYLALGSSSYLFELVDDHEYVEICIPLSEFDPKEVSFTYSDSMVSYWLHEEKRHEKYYNPDLHGKVFTLSEIVEIVKLHGIPNGEWESDPQKKFDFYVEAQVWSFRPLQKYIKEHNQRVDPTVKTPVESGNEQGTAGHP
jgi:hypothetical protein